MNLGQLRIRDLDYLHKDLVRDYNNEDNHHGIDGDLVMVDRLNLKVIIKFLEWSKRNVYIELDEYNRIFNCK